MKNFTYENISNINSVSSSKKDNFFKIEMNMRDGSKPVLTTEYSQYCKWLKKNKKSYKDIFGDFVKDFFSNSQENGMNEIIDKDGNIYSDDDLSNNATNSQIGSSKFDTNKVVQQSVPIRSKVYNGYYGVGIITW